MAAVLCARGAAPAATRSPRTVLDQLDPGDRVWVLPDVGVYQYAGADSTGFWLQPLQIAAKRSAARFWVAPKEAWRLQPTLRLSPMGPPHKRWPAAAATPWDQFCGTLAYGNAALGSLAVVLVGDRAAFEADLLSTGYGAPAGGDVATTVGGGFIRGTVEDDGDVVITAPAGAAGEPLLAVARTHQAAARLSERNPGRPLIFLSTRVTDAIADRSTVDGLAARHRFLLLAQPGRREDLLPLIEAGWDVVEPRGLSGALTGLSRLDEAARLAAWEDRRPGILDQKSPELNEAFAGMDRLGQAIAPEALEDEEVAAVVHLLRSAFFEASDWLSAPGEPELAVLAEAFSGVHARLGRLRSVAGVEALAAAETCRSALDRFALLAQRLSMTPKGECVLQLADAASRAPDFRQAIVTGHAGAATRTAAFLEDLGLGGALPCLTPSALAAEAPFSRLNILSMIRRETFRKLIDPWPAPDLMFLGYAHEVDLYRSRLAARDLQRRRLAPDDAICSRFPFLSPHRAPPAPPRPAEPPPVVDPAAVLSRPVRRPPAATGEQTREARVCRFAGQSWMAVTGERTMTTVRSTPRGLELSTCPGDELEAGDLLLVREGANPDVVREMAESLAGPEVYGPLRRQAIIWREALTGSGLGAEALRKRLGEKGVRRGAAAIRHWISETAPIGPSEEEVTVPAIAAALGQNPDERRWRECVDAIRMLRALHTRAGFSLTEALTRACGGSLVEHSDHETPILLPWGTVWLLEVEDIGPAAPWPYTQINRLRWESDSWRNRLLSRQLLATLTGDAA
jgi:hypothetical protein